MKVTINKPVDINIKTLRLNVRVRYPNDAGIVDTAGELVWEDINNPKMPLLYNINNEWKWRPEIDVETGKIKDWPEIKACINYKICDEFECDILDSNGLIAHFYEGYVPRFFGVNEQNYGDYIIMDIDETGQIIDWKCTEEDIVKMFNE